jgi:rhamnosyltransferase
VIRAKNESRYIAETLSSLLTSPSLEPREVVVVDSGSTDGTVDIVRRFPVTLIEIAPEDFTYGFALNLGIASTSGEVVATLSAHSLPTSPDWLCNIARPFAENPRIAGVYGRQVPRSNATWLELTGMRLTGLLSDKPKLLDKRPLFSNANGAFRRSLWKELPFDEQIGGAEDIAWARTVQQWGYLIAYEPTAAAYHSHGEPLVRHLRRASRDVPTVIGNLLHLGPAGERRARQVGSRRPQPSAESD